MPRTFAFTSHHNQIAFRAKQVPTRRNRIAHRQGGAVETRAADVGRKSLFRPRPMACPSRKRVGPGENQNCRDGRQSDELFHLRKVASDALVFCHGSRQHLN